MTLPHPKLHLIDASGFIFRAFYALPPLTGPDGTPMGAVVGFANMLLKLWQDDHPKHCAVIFDAGRTTFRNDLYPAYKANRSETPPDLVPQFPLIRDLSAAFGLPPVELAGYEADDLIASYAAEAVQKGWDVTIISADKDLMQLMRPHITLFDPMKNKVVDADDVLKKFGVPPEQVLDVQALMGDSTDNIPGVPGIGPKTAAELISSFGSFDALFQGLDTLPKSKRRDALEANKDLAYVSRDLCRLKDDAPLPVAIDTLSEPILNSPNLLNFLEQYKMRSVLNRLPRGAEPVAETPIQTASRPVHQIINTLEKLDELLTQARITGVLAFDTETTDLTPAKADLVGVSLATIGVAPAYVPLGHGQAQNLFDNVNTSQIPQLNPADFYNKIKIILEDSSVLKIAHNAKFDLQFFLKQHINIAPLDDTMLLSYALDAGRHGHGLDELAKVHLNHSMIAYDTITGTGKARKNFSEIPIEQAAEYAAEDAWATLELHRILKPRLTLEQKTVVYERIDRPIAPIIGRMELTGIKVNIEALQQLSHIFGSKMAELDAQIMAATGQSFNLASPKQLGTILFDVLGLPGGKKTKTGDWSTSADILEDLSDQGHGGGILDQILEWRGLAKLKSTYADALVADINPRTGRVHTSYSLAATSTGRLASSNPNLQNIPIRSEDGKLIRGAFIAKDGYTLISADYSQIELRLVAAQANIPALKQAFLDGTDIHAKTASEVFGVPLDQMTPDLRRQAKAINFGIIYGISAFGLGKQLGIAPGDASQFIKTYFARFPELAAYMDRQKELARQHGFVTTLFGRTCTIDGITDKNPARRNFAERQAINAPIQGTAADIIKLAMVDVDRALTTSGLDCTMLLQVHDELVFEVRADQAEQAAALIKRTMEQVVDIGIPLTAEAGIGLTWAQAH